jgi:hypothetical protein
VRKPSIQPPESSVKLRPLQWKKLRVNDPAFDSSVFAGFDELDDVRVDARELEAVFGPKSDADAERAGRLPARPQLIEVFEPKKAQEILILLSKFRGASEAELVEAVRTGNASIVDAAFLRQLPRLLPTEQERTAIAEARAATPDRSLRQAERFSLLLNTAIPDLESRIAFLDYALSADERANDVARAASTLDTAARSILESEAFATLLRTILRIGNFINQGTVRGDAFGFDVSSLAKLADTKSTDGTSNLLNYLVRRVRAEQPGLERFLETLEPVNSAAAGQLDLPEQAQLFAKLGADQRAARAAYDALPADDPLRQRYPYAGEKLLSERAESYAAAADLLGDARESQRRLFEYFGLLPERNATTSLADLLRYVAQFRDAYARQLVALEEEQRLQKRAKLREKQRRQRERRGDSAGNQPDPLQELEALLDEPPTRPESRRRRRRRRQ